MIFEEINIMAQARKYTAEALKRAVGAVKRKELSLRQASLEYGVPVTTIHDMKKPRAPRGRHTDVMRGRECQSRVLHLYGQQRHPSVPQYTTTQRGQGCRNLW